MVKQDVGSVGFHPQLGLNGGIQWMDDGWMDGWMDDVLDGVLVGAGSL
jgi:hypothetical protein